MYRRISFWLLVVVLVVGGIVVWILPSFWRQGFGHQGQGLLALLQDEESLEQFVAWLGWMGPPVLILINALQIVVAPIPAYALFVAAGFLYGTVWGGLYGTLGTLLGATAAMVLTRRFGRPLAAHMVGEDRLLRWSQMTVSRSSVSWAILLLAPVGDLPYFLAGLSQVGIGRILLLTMFTRVPTIFLIAAAGSGATTLPWWQVALLILAMLIGFGVLLRYQEQVVGWFDRQIGNHADELEPSTPPNHPQEAISLQND